MTPSPAAGTTSSPTGPWPSVDELDSPDVLVELRDDLAGAAGEAHATAEAAHRETLRLRQAYLAAEEAFIARVHSAYSDGQVDFRGVHQAYEQVRAWSNGIGLTGFLQRFQCYFPYSPQKLREFADAVPEGEGNSWSGTTGWAGLERGTYPPSGRHVAFVLFDADGRPVGYGATGKFKPHTGRLHKSDGLRWSSWQAFLATDAQDARVKKAELIARYGPVTAPASTAESARDARGG